MAREQQRPAIRVAVAAPYPEIVAIHESSTEYADDVEVCAMISSADAVFDQARLLQPDVLLLSDELGVDGPDTLARLTAVAPNTRLVVLVGGGEGRAPVIADAVLSHHAPAAELRAVIAEAVRPPSAQTAPPAHSRAEPDRAPARLVAVFSGKGGVGTSIVAANLATMLAEDGAAVALVDLDLQYGDQGVILHLEAHPTSIETVVTAGETVEAGVLGTALATSAEGVRVLLAPSRPEVGDLVTAANLEAILGELSRHHDHVVIDCPTHLEERVIGVLAVADHILLVSSFGITSVKDAKTTLRLLQSLGIDRDRVALLLNRTRPRDSSPEEEIARALRFPVLATLPFEARMDESVESGRPLVVMEPHGEFSKRLGVVAGHVARPRDGGVPGGARSQPAAWRLRFRH